MGKRKILYTWVVFKIYGCVIASPVELTRAGIDDTFREIFRVFK